MKLNDDLEIAITGIALRLPDMETTEEYWEHLIHKRDSITKVSQRRKDLAGTEEWDSYFGVLENIDEFDNEFFEISDEVARQMDPQQRLMLEVAQEVLEDSGSLPISNSQGQNIAVYTSNAFNSYSSLVRDYIKREGLSARIPESLIGSMDSMCSTRITHQYNLTGPAYHINSACSSFTVQMKEAYQGIKDSEIEGALILSANLMATEFACQLAESAGIITEDKVCRVFDEKADGSLLGEGVIGIYMESLDRALVNNKNIYGLVKGIGINNDGFALSLTAPNPKKQYEAMRMAYDQAGIDPNEISYVEAHGTGTTIGDPIEFNALLKLMESGNKSKDHSIGIGAAKTNVGHLLAAAGGVGLVKILLSFKHRMMAPSINMEVINPKLQIEKTPFKIITEATPWESKRPRKAGLNCFGLGGTNTHVILEEWIEDRQINELPYEMPFTLSAKTETALEQKIKDLQDFLKENDIDRNYCIGTLNRYRAHYDYRTYGYISKTGELEILKKHQISNLTGKKLLLDGSDLNQIPESLELWKEPIQLLKEAMGRKLKFSKSLKSQLLKSYIKEDIDFEDLKSKWPQSKEGINPIKQKNLRNHLILSLNLESLDLKHSNNEIIDRFSYNEKFGHLVGELYVEGVAFDWSIFHPDGSFIIQPLPHYPFERKSLWIGVEND